MKLQRLALGIACVMSTFAVVACGNAGGATGTQLESDGSWLSDADTKKCSEIQSKFPDIPKEWTVAISPYNGALGMVDPDNPSDIVGFEPDIVQAVANCLGVTISFESQQFASVINSLTSGAAEIGITGLYVKPERVDVMDMVAYMNAVNSMYTLSENADTLRVHEDMCGKRLGATVGSAEDEYLKEYSETCKASGKPEIEISLFQDLGSVFVNIQNGRTDGAVSSDALYPLVRDNYGDDLVTTFQLPEMTYQIAAGISPKAAESGLSAAVLDALVVLHDNGTTAELLEEWTFQEHALIEPELHSSTARE